MALLAGTCYDPASAVTKAVSALQAMTAVDTTNLRLTFTAPASGTVVVKLRCVTHGATTFPRILLGVLDGSAVKLRMSPMGTTVQALATQMMSQEVVGVVTGLTPGNSYTWDAAYSVEVTVSAGLKYGGPNDTTTNNAFGGFVFEIWEAKNLLGGTVYDPTTAVIASTTAALAMTAFDTTNLRLTFTAPASGNVWWRVHGQYHGATTVGQNLLGVLESSTVVGRVAPIMGEPATNLATACIGLEASGIITGLSAGSHTYDAAYGVETVGGAGGIKYGGPDNATTNDAFGGLAFEIWSA